MGGQQDQRPRRSTDGGGIEWAFDSEGSSARMADPRASGVADGREGGDERPDLDVDADALRRSRVRRWASRLAGAGLAILAVLGGVRAWRGDRTHRLIQRDVQHVVQLEAQAMADGDRELFNSLQDLTRRRALRRPDVAADERRAVGPWPGVFFTDDPPLVSGVEVAAKDADYTVESVTATVRVAATDGARIGRFEQARRMTRRADGHWQHAASLTTDRPEDVERFVSSRIHASFPAADGPVLRPVLEAANDAVRAYCVDQGRCTGRARLAFGAADAPAADIAIRLTAPSSPSGWRPVDDTARALLTFCIARAAALRLDYAFDRAFRPDGTTANWPDGPGRDGAIVTALVDAVLASHLDPATVEAWAADTAAADAGLTLWHFGALVGRPRIWNDETVSNAWHQWPPRDIAIAARNFAAVTLRRAPTRLSKVMAAWPAEIATTGDDWLTPRSIERDFGPGGLAAVLDWPTPQAPFVADGAVVLACGGEAGSYIAGRVEGVADLTLLACGGDPVSATAWSPDGSALAVACYGNVSEAEPIPWEDRGTVALVRRDAPGGWSVAPVPPSILPATGTGVRSLLWAPDGHRLALEVRTWSEPIYDPEPPSHVRILSVDLNAVDPWSARTDPLGLPPVTHPLTQEPIRALSGGPHLAWSPDGNVLAVGGNDGQIALQPANGGAAAMLRGWAMAWSPDGSRIARLLGPGDGADPTASAVKGSLALSIVDAKSLTQTAAITLDAASMDPSSDSPFHPVRADDLSAILDLAWSDDGRWVGAAIQTSTRCRDRVDCAVGFAWQPESAVLRQVVNGPLTGQENSWWASRAAWVPASHRYAVFDSDTAGMDADGEVAFVLDADGGHVEIVVRSQSASLAALLGEYSPDGRWHARRDAMSKLVVEPASGIGGYRAGDAATGWRFNRPFCSPHLLWSGGR